MDENGFQEGNAIHLKKFGLPQIYIYIKEIGPDPAASNDRKTKGLNTCLITTV